MSVKYRLVKKKNLGKDQEAVPEKVYAQPVYMELVSFESLLDEIVEAGIPNNQVKGVIDRMKYLIRKHLSAGRRVQFGEFGNFRYGVGSIGSTTDEDFDPEMIKTPRIVFSPGSLLRKAKQDAKFERFAFVPVDSGNGSGGGEDDRPGEL